MRDGERGLFLLWIQIVQKTFTTRNGDGKMVPNQVAGEILSFFTRNNFVVLDRGETITYVNKQIQPKIPVTHTS